MAKPTDRVVGPSVHAFNYKGALDKGHDVRVLIHETFGGLHPSARSLLREMAATYAARLDGSPEGPRKRSFRSFHLARISCAVARGVAFV